MMTTSGHDETMKSANVSELKSRLSEYLRAVRGGETIEVRDRDTAVARLVPLDASEDDFRVVAALHPEWARRKVVAVRPRRKTDSTRLLREDRDSR